MTSEKLMDLLGDIDDSILSKAIDADNSVDSKELCSGKSASIKKMTIKKIVLIAAAVLLLIGSVTALAAGPLRDTWVGKIIFGSGSSELILDENIKLIHINEDAPKQNCTVSLIQAEEMIGVDLLNSPLFTNPEIYYKPFVPYDHVDPKGRRLGKGKEIESIDLWYANSVVYPDSNGTKYISTNITMLTDHATENTIPDNGLDATGGKEHAETYTLTSLDAAAVFSRVDWDKSRLSAELLYKDIYYQFVGINVSEDEMKAFLDTLN